MADRENRGRHLIYSEGRDGKMLGCDVQLLLHIDGPVSVMFIVEVNLIYRQIICFMLSYVEIRMPSFDTYICFMLLFFLGQ